MRRRGVGGGGGGGVGGGVGVGIGVGGVGFVLLLAGVRGLLLLLLELLLLQAALLLAELGAAVLEPHLAEGDAGERGGQTTTDTTVRVQGEATCRCFIVRIHKRKNRRLTALGQPMYSNIPTVPRFPMMVCLFVYCDIKMIFEMV